MTLSRIIFATMILFISTNANAQLLPDLNAMDKLLGDTVRQLQKELDDMNTEQTTETNSEEEAEKQAEEKRKQEEAEKQAEEKRKQAEAKKQAEEKRKQAEAKKQAEEKRKQAEAKKQAEEKRKQAEAKKQAEENAKIDEEAGSSIASFVDAFKMKLQVEKTIQKAETAFQEANKLAKDTEKWLSR